METPCVWKSETNQFTVGDIAHLQCANLPDGSGYKIVEGDKPDYRIVLLKDSNEAGGLQVTSYIPGTHKLDGLRLDHAGTIYRVAPFEFEVQSVIPATQPVMPYASFPAKSLPFPWSFVIAVILAWMVLSASVILLTGWSRRRKKYLLEIRKSEGFTDPLGHFYKNLRELKRVQLARGEYQQFVEGLHPALQVYFEQRLARPVSMKNMSWLRTRLKKAMRRDESLFIQFHRRVRELERMRGMRYISEQDARQISRDLEALVSRVHSALPAQRGQR
jgi:hypothetical protein